ncbi:hypothetical protein ACFX19_022327 [Malus domestica]
MYVNLRAPWQGRLAKMPNLYSHSRKLSQQDYFLKIEETLLSESQESDSQQVAFSKIEEAPFSKSRELDPRQDCLFEN